MPTRIHPLTCPREKGQEKSTLPLPRPRWCAKLPEMDGDYIWGAIQVREAKLVQRKIERFYTPDAKKLVAIRTLSHRPPSPISAGTRKRLWR